jgi:hypothetical protein
MKAPLRHAVRSLSAILLLSLSVAPSKGSADTYTAYRQEERTWIVGNSGIEVAFQLTPGGGFHYRWIRAAATGRVWRAPDNDPGSPIHMTVDGVLFDGDTAYTLQSFSFVPISTPYDGVRFSIVLTPASASGRVQFEADVYSGQPFLRYRAAYKNLSASPSTVTQADMLAWKFQDEGKVYQDFFVNQWNAERAMNFEPHETELSTADARVEMFTGAKADHAAWRALRDSQDNGLVAAWEFDGRAIAHAEDRREAGVLQFDAEIAHLHHRVDPGDWFHVPDAFIGVYHGDWDEAGYRTQRFAESVLAAPFPEPDKFPYAMFDTWGYGENINETTVMDAARLAAAEGAEVFIVDLGWARAIGDWHPDHRKFPHGLKPVSDYVHSLGMKFGLHLPFLQAAANTPVLLSHPDWEAVDPDQTGMYFGAPSLCPSHKPARDWIISELNRVIQEYGVDWLTQDGSNMVKICESASHTHAPGDSNYANAVDGLDAILQSVQKINPSVLWENCEDGGSMQTFHMIQRYVTSIANDASDALTTRRGVWGAISAFPPRYTERYMADDPNDTYQTRSYMFGGPMILMNRITEWSSETLAFTKAEIDLYKSIRATIRDSKIYHLMSQPDGTFNDAVEAYDQRTDQSFIFVYGNSPQASSQYIEPRGLRPSSIYRVSVREAGYSYVSSGQNLMKRGLAVGLQSGMAEIITITPD